jgi:hypothetical protein
MTRPSTDGGTPTFSRRSYLAAGAAALSATAGCLESLGVTNGDGANQNGDGNGDGAAVERVDNVDSALLDGKVVVLARGSETAGEIDPETTDTPIQDGLDFLGANRGGELRLPPASVFERGAIRPYSDTAIVGFGPGVSEVGVPPSTDGIRFDRDAGVNRIRLDGFALNGPGPGEPSGVAIRHSGGNTQDLSVGRLLFWGWNDSVYRVESGTGPFQCRHDHLTVYDCDAGDADGLFEFRSSYGPANWFGTVAAYPTATESGRDSTAVFTRGGTQHIDQLTLGGTVGPAVRQTGGSQFHAEGIHWEPVDQRAVPEAIVRLLGRGPATIGNIKQATGTARYVYEVGTDPESGTPPARKRLGSYYRVGTEARLSENVVNLTAPNAPDRPSFYDGPAVDVTVTHEHPGTGGFRALGDAGTGVDTP